MSPGIGPGNRLEVVTLLSLKFFLGLQCSDPEQLWMIGLTTPCPKLVWQLEAV